MQWNDLKLLVQFRGAIYVYATEIFEKAIDR